MIDLSFRRAPRFIAVGATILSLLAAGCSDGATGPAPRRESTARARMDGDPPTRECRSGWTQADGRWICGDDI